MAMIEVTLILVVIVVAGRIDPLLFAVMLLFLMTIDWATRQPLRPLTAEEKAEMFGICPRCGAEMISTDEGWKCTCRRNRLPR